MTRCALTLESGEVGHAYWVSGRRQRGRRSGSPRRCAEGGPAGPTASGPARRAEGPGPAGAGGGAAAAGRGDSGRMVKEVGGGSGGQGGAFRGDGTGTRAGPFASSREGGRGRGAARSGPRGGGAAGRRCRPRQGRCFSRFSTATPRSTCRRCRLRGSAACGWPFTPARRWWAGQTACSRWEPGRPSARLPDLPRRNARLPRPLGHADRRAPGHRAPRAPRCGGPGIRGVAEPRRCPTPRRLRQCRALSARARFPSLPARPALAALPRFDTPRRPLWQGRSEMYVAVKGGERAIRERPCLARRGAARRHLGRRTEPCPDPRAARSRSSRVMAEGSPLRPRPRGARPQGRRAAMSSRRSSWIRAYRHDPAPVRLQRPGGHRGHGLPTGASRRPSRTCRAVRFWGRPSITTPPAPPTSGWRPGRGADTTGGGQREAEPPGQRRSRHVLGFLGREGLIEPAADGSGDAPPDLTREPLEFPASRPLRLQALARADEGFLLGLAYSTQRGLRPQPRLSWASFASGRLPVEMEIPELGLRDRDRRGHPHRMRDASTSSPTRRPSLRSSPAATGSSSARPSARPIAMRWSTARLALGGTRRGRRRGHPRRDAEFRAVRTPTTFQATGFLEHIKTAPHYVDFQSELELVRKLRARGRRGVVRGGHRMTPDAYNFAYLDEQTKRMIRRAIPEGPRDSRAIRLPFASREMPMPYEGLGAPGGVQVTAAVLTPEDRLKVIDQGADDTTNAVSIRAFFRRTPRGSRPPPRRRRPRSSRPVTGFPRRRSRRGRSWSTRCQSPRTPAVSRTEGKRKRAGCTPSMGLRPDARQALRGHQPSRPYRHRLSLPRQGRGHAT